MTEQFSSILAIGGKTNSLGRADEVINSVLKDRKRLEELYDCMFDDDPWVRMRAADSIEKVCREHPDWLLPYIDRFERELASNKQSSIQWHLAQIYKQVKLTPEQKHFAINWLKGLISTKDVDWIVSANAMATLADFTRDGSFPKRELIALLHVQKGHKSNAVIKRADKFLAEFER